MYLKYFIVIAIALIPSLQLNVFAQTKGDLQDVVGDSSRRNFQDRLASPWQDAVITHTLEYASEINRIKFSPDGEILASVGASQITLWQVDRGEVQRILPGHYATESAMEIAPTAIAFSPDSRFLATATWSQGLFNPDSAILVWDTTTGEEVLSIEHREGCRQILFDVEGEILYGACGLGITAWSFPAGEKLFSFDTDDPLEAIALSPDGKVMATVDNKIPEEQQKGKHNKIQLWQLDQQQPKLLNTLDGHANNIAQLEFTPDGKKLVSSSYDGKINVWDWQQGKKYRNTNNLYSNQGLFSLSANSRLIAGNFHSSAMTNLISGLPLRNVVKIPQRGKTNTVAFSPQGDIFAWAGKSTKSNNPVIYLWQTNPSQSEVSPREKGNYQAIPITEYWGNQEQLGTGETIKLETTNPSPRGKDPQAIALAALGLKESIESEQEEVELDYPQENLATVTITQKNLRDDSIVARRYLVEFAPYGDQTEELWQVIWVGQQFK